MAASEEVDWKIVEEDLAQFSDVWKQIKFDSLPHVVEILSDKNPQSALEALKEQRDSVEDLINDVVSAYHVGFNKAIHNYSEILRMFGSSSYEITSLDNRLNDSKKLLSAKHSHLQQLWYRSITLRNIISLMDNVDAVSKAPAKIEELISNNKFYAAIQLLLLTQNTIDREGLQNVGGLREIKNDLKSLQSKIFYKVVDELNDHIYNKGQYSMNVDAEAEMDDDISDITIASVPINAPLHPSIIQSSSFNASSSSVSSKLKAKSMRRMASDYTKSDSKSAAGDVGSFEDLSEDIPTTPSSEKSSNSLELDHFGMKKNALPPPWLAGSTANEFVENLCKSESSNHVKYLQTMVEILFLLKKIPAAGAILCHKLRGKIREIIISEINSRASVLEASRPRLEQVNQNVLLNSPSKKKFSYQFSSPLKPSLSPSPSFSSPNRFLKPSPFGRKEDKKNISNYQTFQISHSQKIIQELLDSIFSTLTNILGNHIVVGQYIENKLEKFEEVNAFYNEKQNFEDNIFNGGYTIGLAWTCIQNECQQLVCDLLRASPDGSSLESNMNYLKIANNDDDELTFSFRFSDTANIVSPGGITSGGVLGGDGMFHAQRKKQIMNQENYGTSLLIAEKGIYLTSACYKPIIQFIDKVNNVLPEEYSDNLLRTFINNFVKDQFLPNVRNDYRSKVTDALSNPSSFKPKKRNLSNFENDSEYERAILNSLLTVENVVGEVLTWTISMPNFATEFVVLIQALLEKTLEKCKSFFTESVLGALSVSLVSRQDLDNLMQKQNSINLLQGNFMDESFRRIMDETSLENENYEIDLQIFNMLYSLLPIKEEQLILDPNKLIEISALSDSLEHMSNFIFELGQTDSFSKPQRSTSKKMHRRTPSTVALSTGLARLSEKYRSLSLECLRTLRVEMLLQCIYYLHSMTQRSYVNDADAEDAEDFIVALNSQITKVHEDISMYLPVGRLNYVFGGICNISSNCIIKLLEELEAINSLGVRQIQRNCIALQQTLTSLGANSPQSVLSTFDRVAEYYELLNRPSEALWAYVKEHNTYFSFEEYKTLFTITVPGRVILFDDISHLQELVH